MKLARAKEVLDDLLTDGPYWPPETRQEAVILAIEAIKRIQAQRKFKLSYHLKLLPGETVDTDSP